MKSPRTLLSELEEVGCRLAQIPGTRGGHLLLSEIPKANQNLAKQIRTTAWPPAFASTMLALASRIERKSFPGLIGLDSNGCFCNRQGELISTPESIAAAKSYYHPDSDSLSQEESEKAWFDKVSQMLQDSV